jgi:uncharacterized protein
MERIILKKLIDWKDRKARKPLLLRGARQVGKTWILRHFGEKFFPKVHYLNFEKDKTLDSLFSSSLDPVAILNNYELVYNTSVNEKDLLIFDEVQESPNALTSLKYFAELKPHQPVCAAGSNIGIVSSTAGFPVGKVEDIIMYPMNFFEFLQVIQPELAKFIKEKKDLLPIPEILHKKLTELFFLFYVTGGLPEAVSEFAVNRENTKTAFEKTRIVHERLIFNYISDFAKHAGAVNAAHIHSVFDHVPHYLSTAVDNSIQRFRFKDVIPGKSRYADLEGPIDWLINSGVLYRISIVERSGIPLLSYRKHNIFKLALFDSGLLHTMLNIPFSQIVQQDYGTFKGYIAENFVAGSLVANRFSPLFSWQGRQSEIEFLIQHEENIIPVEVKSGSRTRAKSLSVYSEIYSPKIKVIASLKNLELSNNKTLNIPLYLIDNLRDYLEELVN